MSLPPRLNDPNFPSYYRECFDNRVDVFWYHPAFSQSQYPPGQEGSEACTLICLLLAQKICAKKLKIWDVEQSFDTIVTMAEAIAEGNRTHTLIMRRGLVPYAYLNTEEALKYGGRCLKTMKEWTFYVYHEDIREGLYRHIESYLRTWYRQPRGDNLFMLLITSGRTILFIFQESTYKVTLFDSHSHNASGAPARGLVVAQTGFKELESLCDWYVAGVLTDCYNIRAEQYELAFIYHMESNACGHGASSCNCVRRF